MRNDMVNHLMKNRLLLVLMALIVFGSCSTDVDLYADYKDTAIVYGLIDAKADTNYVKITRAFCSTNDHPINAFEVAPIYDSSNYPGKLDAYFLELKSTSGQQYQPTGRMFYLDTLTIHNKKEGLFYAPHQKLYYTPERFKTSLGSDKYRYRLYVIKPDHDTVSAEIGVVSGDIEISSALADFQAYPTNASSYIIFSSTEEAVLYEIGMRFNYWERHPGQPMEKKEVSWSYSPKTIGMYEKVPNTDNLYRSYYSPNILFNVLEHAIGNDTANVTRYIDNFVVTVAAAGDDFNIYYQFLQTASNGLTLSTEYSNIQGGYGILSSRIFVNKEVKLTSGTKLDLFRQPWGFQEH